MLLLQGSCPPIELSSIMGLGMEHLLSLLQVSRAGSRSEVPISQMGQQSADCISGLLFPWCSDTPTASQHLISLPIGA